MFDWLWKWMVGVDTEDPKAVRPTRLVRDFNESVHDLTKQVRVEKTEMRKAKETACPE